MLSKMHYAAELAKMGNKVFFVNPPRESISTLIKKGDMVSGVQLLHIKPLMLTLLLRHKLFPLYSLLMQRYANHIRKIAGGQIDELWNFNPHSFPAMKGFAAKKNILLIYDFYKGRHVESAAKEADLVVTPSQLIADYYKPFNKAVYFIQHGLGAAFAEQARRRLLQIPVNDNNKTIKVGYTGNLLRQAINTGVLQKIIIAHPQIEFHFWGPSSIVRNNVTDVNESISTALLQFIGFLEKEQNVFLHGVTAQDDMAKAMQDMDAFLFVYAATTDMNGASNSHKLLEYISTGKVVVSSMVSTYKGTGLLQMCDDDNGLPALFDEVINNLASYNTIEKQQDRIAYSLQNTYNSQVKKIHQLLNIG